MVNGLQNNIMLPDLVEVSVNVFSLVSDFSEDKLSILDVSLLHSFPVIGQNFSKILKYIQYFYFRFFSLNFSVFDEVLFL